MDLSNVARSNPLPADKWISNNTEGKTNGTNGMDIILTLYGVNFLRHIFGFFLIRKRDKKLRFYGYIMRSWQDVQAYLNKDVYKHVSKEQIACK